MTRRIPARVNGAVRLLIALFCWFTAAYAFVSSSAFAYLQFLKPRVIEWVARAGELHRFAAWAWLALVASSSLRSGKRARLDDGEARRGEPAARWRCYGTHSTPSCRL